MEIIIETNKTWKPYNKLRIYSPDIGMEFGLEKCAMLVMKSGKWHVTERVEQPNQVVIRTLGEKET